MGFLPLVACKRAWIQGARSEGDDGICQEDRTNAFYARRSLFKQRRDSMPEKSFIFKEKKTCHFREPLINYLCGMKRKAHGVQKPRHIKKIVEVAGNAQSSDSPA